MRNKLIDLIGAYGLSTAKLAEAQTMTEAAIFAALHMKALSEVVDFLDKHYELKEKK
jgi:hypothetical protein